MNANLIQFWLKLPRSWQLMGLGPAMWAFVASSIALPFVMYRTLDEHTSHEALRQAKAITLIATVVRSYYTTNVVGPARSNNGLVTLTENYHQIKGGIPIPATMAIELGNAIQERTGAREFEFRFVSDLPFRRRVRPPLDEFQMSALRYFRSDIQGEQGVDTEMPSNVSEDSYWRVEKTEAKTSLMRLAVPVLMEANCVSCHNGHPDSPVHNWNIGDVRGIQEVVVSFDTEGQLQDSKEAVIFLAWLVAIGWLALREHRYRMRRLNQLNHEMDQSRQTLKNNALELESSIRELQTKTTVLDMAPFCVLIMDPVDTGVVIQYANRAFCVLMEYEPDEVIGRSPDFLYGPQSESANSISLDKALRERVHLEVEISNYTRTGQVRLLRWLVFPSFDQKGVLLNMVACMTDITEIRRNDEERQRLASDLQESTKLESLALAIAGIAHDLNTPIGVAVTASSLLRQTSEQLVTLTQASPLDKDQIHNLSVRIGKSADMTLRNLLRASQLVKSFKETTANATRSEWRRVRLFSLLDSLVVTMSPLMRRARCEVFIDCPPELIIYIEPGALSQALTNLLINSTLHAFDDIEKREININVRLIKDGWVRIDVADNGNGMTEQAAAKAFTPFFTTRRNHGGSGLGLFSCRRSIEQILGGRITFETAPGQGTTFHVELPLDGKPVTADTAEKVIV